jgi:peptidoglycan/LPS O-acetylase OafA/YrhL
VTRRDIQGLRAISVLAVIFFHLNPDIFKGGFLGVDLFFVISGFVITAMMLRDYSEVDTFKLIPFLTKRFMRLMPSLYVLLIIVSILSYLTFSPIGVLETTFGTAINALLFNANNFLAIQAIDYFAVPPTTNPLLHLWSISVEIHFYVFISILSLVITIFASLIVRILVFGCVLSLGIFSFFVSFLKQYGFPVPISDVLIGYYSTLGRLYEFFFGVSSFFIMKYFGRLSLTRSSTILANTSGVIIIVSFFSISSTNKLLPIFCIFPLLATCYLLAAKSLTNTSIFVLILQSRLLNWVGNRSYSIYLFHWPMIAFIEIYFGDGFQSKVLTFILTLFISNLNYKFVEQRFRNNSKGKI